MSELADAVGWRPLFKYRTKRLSEHINVKEARAYRSFVRRKARSAAAHGTRQLGLLDSAVVRGAAAKGRSSSQRLNNILRPAVPDQLAAKLMVGTLPVPTKHNPADDPPRDSPVRRRPAAAYPAWLADLDEGDFMAWGKRYAAGRSVIPEVLFPVSMDRSEYR